MGSSRFENFDIGRAIAAYLKIKGLANMPTDLSTDMVIPTLDIYMASSQAQPNNGEGQFVADNGTAKSAAGNPTVQQWIISDQATDFARLGPVGPGSCSPISQISPIGIAYRIDTLACMLSYNAAGATADTGKLINLNLYLDETNGDGSRAIPIVQFFPWVTIATGRLDYMWDLHGFSNLAGSAQSSAWNGRVPSSPGFANGRIGLYFLLSKADGTNFPAATTFRTFQSARYSINGIVPDIGA